MARLVTDPHTRKHLEQAEAHAANGDSENAVAECAIAFASLRLAFIHATSVPSRDSSIVHSIGSQPLGERDIDLQRLARYVGQLSDAVSSLEGRVEVLNLGVEPARLQRFTDLVPRVHIMADRKTVRNTSWTRSVPLTDADVRYCYEFVVGVALALQRNYPSAGELIERVARRSRTLGSTPPPGDGVT